MFLTLYLQLLGMGDGASSALMALFLGGSALGGLVGGFLGDKAARMSPYHGRIVVCQLSVFAGVPFSYILFKVTIPYELLGAAVSALCAFGAHSCRCMPIHALHRASWIIMLKLLPRFTLVAEAGWV